MPSKLLPNATSIPPPTMPKISIFALMKTNDQIMPAPMVLLDDCGVGVVCDPAQPLYSPASVVQFHLYPTPPSSLSAFLSVVRRPDIVVSVI